MEMHTRCVTTAAFDHALCIHTNATFMLTVFTQPNHDSPMLFQRVHILSDLPNYRQEYNCLLASVFIVKLLLVTVSIFAHPIEFNCSKQPIGIPFQGLSIPIALHP